MTMLMILFSSQSTTVEVGIWAILSLGFFLGLKHALDADHLIAVSTIVSQTKDWKQASKAGIIWGLGHTSALLFLGIFVIAFQYQVPEKLALLLEFLVGIMLVYLGVALIFKIYQRASFHFHEHTHDGYRHVHPHFHTEKEIHQHDAENKNDWHHDPKFRGRSLFIGLVHGFAGSAALMLMVLATISSKLWDVLYIVVFGVGSVGGMMFMSALLSVPFLVAHKRYEKWFNYVQMTAAIVSIIFGCVLMYEIGFVEGIIE